ncbi:MAG TPA: hypothetical protein VFM18_17465 [Methanosarcina sp.]|nr:hypothetical protein [Methanosarcina sp.]
MAIIISAVAAYYSVVGLTAIFAAATMPVIIMGGALEFGKIVATVWLHNNWKRVPIFFKLYLVPAVAFLMFLTSMGIFGFLSKAHMDQSVPSGDIQAQVQIFDEKIATERENIVTARKALSQLDAAVDQVMSRSDDENGAVKANRIRVHQQADRAQLNNEITKAQNNIVKLQEQRAPIASQARKVEAEVGPIKYIAAFIYGDNPDQNLLEKAVRWVIIVIVIVFDPLALCLILAANKQLEWAHQGRGSYYHDEEDLVAEAALHPESIDPDHDITSRVAATVAEDPSDRAQAYYDDINMQLTEAREPAPEPFIPEEVVHEPFVGIEAGMRESDLGGFESLSEEDLEVSAEEPAPEEVESPAFSVEESTENETAIEELITQDANQEVPRVLEAMPHPGRHAIHADNAQPITGKPVHTDFGNSFPPNPEKGDMYLRTDFLPNRLFKFNGTQWIEIDKSHTDVYAYEEQYIKHLIDEIDAGRYDADTLTDTEREQIKKYLDNQA